MGWIRSRSARHAIHTSCKELGGSHKWKRNVDQSGQGLRSCFTRKTGRRHRSLLLPRLCGETRVVWVIRSFCFIGRFHFIQISSEKIESDWKIFPFYMAPGQDYTTFNVCNFKGRVFAWALCCPWQRWYPIDLWFHFRFSGWCPWVFYRSRLALVWW